MIFGLRQPQEKAREYDKDLFVTFVDLKGLWVILKKWGVPERMLSVIMSFHQGMMVADPFIVFNGTKQACVLAPLLFVLYFSDMLETTFENVKGARFEFRTSGWVVRPTTHQSNN